MASTLLLRRSFHTTHRLLADVPAPAVKRPIGGFRGGIIGFLAGFSVASGFAAYQLLEEYKIASSALQASIEQLQANTDKARVSAHLRRIEAVETDLKTLTGAASTKEETSKVRAELKKAHDGLKLEFLDLKAHIWGLRASLQLLSMKFYLRRAWEMFRTGPACIEQGHRTQ
ncbi:hypothetical protein EXIGLDRAFT_604482 [Exidia glandulosa HHB12029]|uniref:Uncharacterized protein n=1 Tax=Exidia glandulosa HHB12029 TaxID=1314781 RepID=A0A165N9I9_EXIGL|nr:hypothetical protein EXIGLDRAFT_604482 [Exidia glandulosa HHB12029]